jgi:large subunit ribosomal protein L31
MPKKEIHPEWYSAAPVFCDGQLVLEVGSVAPSLNVDVWSGTHPLYSGSGEILDVEGRVERFVRRYSFKKPCE